MPRLLVALTLVLTAASALADIGPKPTTSGVNPRPAGADLEGIEVEMAEEQVDLLLRRVREQEDRLDVRAVFRMRNHGDEASFETGFPVSPVTSFESFAVTIEGKPVAAELVDRDADGKKERWYVWTATYPGHAESTHIVDYSVKIYHRPVSPQLAGYVLHTGAGWKGPIGKAVVTLRTGEGLSLDHLSHLLPLAGGERLEDRVVWTFTSLEPTEDQDIRIQYTDSTRPEVLARARKDTERRWAAWTAVAVYLSQIPGQHLRTRFTPGELEDYLDALEAIVAGWKAVGDRVVLPRTNEEGDRSYVANPTNLLAWIGRAAAVAKDYPTSERARRILKVYLYLGEKFLAGKLYAGDRPLEFQWRGKVLNDTHRAAMEQSIRDRKAKVEAWVEAARAVLRPRKD